MMNNPQVHLSWRGFHVVLCGFMGAGKSSVGARLAAMLSRPFVDTDTQVEAKLGCSITTAFDKQGELFFRAAESTIAREIAQAPSLGWVVATGGGLLVQPSNRIAFEAAGHGLFHLAASNETLLQRLSKDDDTRPLAQGVDPSGLEQHMDSRRPIYSTLQYQVDTDGKTVQQVCLDVLAMMTQPHQRLAR